MSNKSILLTQKYKDGSVDTVVWCPFWEKKPDLKKSKEEGKLVETDKYYQIITNDEKTRK